MRKKQISFMMMSRFLAGFLVLTPAALADVSSWYDTVPRDWYVLPEDSDQESEAMMTDSLTTDVQSLAKFDAALTNIFHADAEALDNLGEVSYQAPDPQPKPPNYTPWRFFAIGFELGISAKGILAPLGIKGTASCDNYWLKKTPKKFAPEKRESMPSRDESPVDYAYDASNFASVDAFKQQLEPMIKMAVSTKKVRDERSMRDNLYKAANQFYGLAKALDHSDGRVWWVQRFRVDFWVDGSGRVHPNVVIGAEVKFRFEWHRLMKLEPEPAGERGGEQLNATQAKFLNFVNGLAIDAEAYNRGYEIQGGFVPNYIRLGIGISASGNFGIAKFGGGVYGYLYLNSAPRKDSSRYSAYDLEATDFYLSQPVDYIVNDAKDEHLEYAEANGIPYEVHELDGDGGGGGGLFKQIIYKIDRSRLRRGLSKAGQMASRFAARAANAKGRKWYLSEMRPAFELSIGGDLKLVSVYGIGSVQVDLIRNQP